MAFDYSVNKGDFSALWKFFKNSLIQTISETNFKTAWNSRPDRTRLYFDGLLKTVAIKMQLEFLPEMKFRVDGTMYLEGSQRKTKIPIVLIESENGAKKSDAEVYKFCLLNAPLKILMISNEWNDSTIKELSEGYWDYIIEDFAELTILTGYFVVIVAEWMENLRFFSYVYNDKEKKIESDLLIEKE